MRIYVYTTVDTTHKKKMSSNTTSSLILLPIELIYRILDHLQLKDVFLSVRNVCQRLDSITDIYHRYQVNFEVKSYLDFDHLRSVTLRRIV